ncbi:hypothetical protein D3C72_2523650 [compost metagenome]
MSAKRDYLLPGLQIALDLRHVIRESHHLNGAPDGLDGLALQYPDPVPFPGIKQGANRHQKWSSR